MAYMCLGWEMNVLNYRNFLKLLSYTLLVSYQVCLQNWMSHCPLEYPVS